MLPALLALAQLAPSIMGLFTKNETAQKAADVVSGVARAVTGKPTEDEALEAIKADPKLLIEYQNGVNEQAIALMQEETKRLEAVNETMRSESQSGDPFVRRARPAFIWTMAVTWGIQMFCLSAAVLFYPEKAGALIKSIGELTSMWGIALGVIGVYFKARSDDKKTAAGVPAPSMFELVGNLFGKKG